MHQQGLTFNNCTLCPHCIYVFYIYLAKNSDLCHLQHKLAFLNRRAAARYRALASIIPGRQKFSWKLSF